VELLHWVGSAIAWSAAAGAVGRREAARRHRPAVIARPQLLLADEPTGNVDPNLRSAAAAVHRAEQVRHHVVIATHDIGLMDQYRRRRLVLHEGGCIVYD
jgi:cell division transport system ATP-binding protein